MNSFQEIITLQKILEEKLAAFGKDAFKTAFEQFFIDNPNVDGIIWSQYTPYFNDGDSCIFRVNEPYLISDTVAAEYPEAVDDYMHENAIGEYSCRDIPFANIYKQFNEIWQQIPEAIFLAVFNDHVQVTVKRDGTFEIDECSHD